MKTRYLIWGVSCILLCVFPASEGFSQDPGVPDTVRLANLVSDVSGPPYQGTAVLPIRVFNDEYLATLYIPLKWMGPLLGDSARFAGEREPYTHFGGINMGSKGCSIFFTVPYGGPFCPPGDDTLVYLYFSVEDTGFASFDTTSGGPAENYLHFYDSLLNKIEPYFERPRLYHITPPYLPGDVNNDGQIDLGDVVFLINYLYKQGQPPEPIEVGDMNGDCVVDIGDIVYLINYLYKGGPAPGIGCA